MAEAVGSVVPKVPHEQIDPTPRENGCHRPKQELQPPFQKRRDVDGLACRRRANHPDCGCLSIWVRKPHILGPIEWACDTGSVDSRGGNERAGKEDGSSLKGAGMDSV